MDFNIKFLEFKKDVSETGNRIGYTHMSYKLPLDSSNYYDVCWWTLGSEPFSFAVNDTTFVYTETESYIGGVIFALLSIVGAILNFLLIVALLSNSKLRKEYLTKTIVSIALTDFLWSICFLPLFSLHYFQR